MLPLILCHFLFHPRTNKKIRPICPQEESSLCELLLDTTDSSGPSLCGSSSGSSHGVQRRRASAPFSNPRAPNFRHYRYRPQSQLGEVVSGLRTNRGPAAAGQSSSQRRAILLQESLPAPADTTTKKATVTTTTSSSHQQQKPQVVIGTRGGRPMCPTASSPPNDTAAAGNGVANGSSSMGVHVQPSTSSPVKSEPPHHQMYSNSDQRRPTSPTVRINLGPFEGASAEPPPTTTNGGGKNKHRLVDKESASDRRGKQRKWTAHQGRNRFFFNGRLVMARQGSIFLLTLFLITFTMALFCVFDLPYLSQEVSLAIPIVAAALFLLVLSSLLKTALSDPGICPRAEPREVLEWERQCQDSDPFFHQDEWAQPRTRIVNIRGQPTKLKYCFTCCIFRPPRSSHCSICDNCVLNFDHHCPWLGNCIGLRNYRHFYIFITSLSLLDAFMGFCVGLHLYLLSGQDNNTFMDALKASPPSMLTGLINVISIWSVLGLSGFHTYLLALVRNPYSSGDCIRNILDTICAPEKPSLMDRRGFLPDQQGSSAIYVDADVLNKLGASRRLREHNYLSLLTLRGGNNSSAPSLTAVAGERSKKERQSTVDSKNGVSSCPSSPPRQRRSNSNSARMRELFKQSEADGDLQRVVITQGKPLSGSLDRNHQHRTRMCHSSNLIAPIERISTEHAQKGGTSSKLQSSDGKPGRTNDAATSENTDK